LDQQKRPGSEAVARGRHEGLRRSKPEFEQRKRLEGGLDFDSDQNRIDKKALTSVDGST
jgi:hypothetical protein